MSSSPEHEKSLDERSLRDLVIYSRSISLALTTATRRAEPTTRARPESIAQTQAPLSWQTLSRRLAGIPFRARF